jgi:hypothetical protein
MGIDVRWQGLSSHSHPTSSTADFFPAATFGVSAVRAEVVRSMARITWKGDLAMNEAIEPAPVFLRDLPAVPR